MVVVCLLPLIVPNRYIIHLLVMSMIYFVVTTGLNILTGYTGKLSLGHAGFFGLGAYVSALLCVRVGFPVWIAVAATTALLALFGMALGYPTLRLQGHYLSIVTLGTGEILMLIITNWKSLTNGPGGLRGIPPLSVFGYTLSSETSQYIFMAVVSALCLWVTSRIVDSHLGRALRAIMDSETASEAIGINVARYRITAFGISTAYAGLAGALFAHLVGYISPYSFQSAESFAILGMLVVGGIGTMYGPLVGSIVMTFLPEYLRAFTDFRLILNAAVTIILLIKMPKGLVGVAGALARRWRRR
ncbi:MAG: branched-chain amino acid ABC transporter permease [Firmicutes bacterium]|nr:branched-chain amino acid ABC transporter permease [Bacillota bacterium]